MEYKAIRQILLNLYSNKELTEEGVLQVYDKYLAEIRKLAYRKHSEAQYDLAQHYENFGLFGDPSPFFNPKKRFYWYSKSAENNHAAAYNNLGDLIERGDGCEKDLNKALKFYKKSMEMGDPLGKNNYRKMVKDLHKGGIYS